jgi:hypothetical protein
VLTGISSTYCQETTGKSQEQAVADSQAARITPEKIDKAIVETEKLVVAAQAADAKNAAQQIGISLADFNSYTAGLQELKVAYYGLLAILKDQATLKKEEAFLRDKI